MTAAQVLCIPMPLHIHSEANGSHGHHMARARKVKAQRQAVAWCLKPHKVPTLPATVTLVRISPGKLDEHDNLPRAFKAVVDELAKWMGVKDNDARLTWQYAQRSEGRSRYACEIVIESRFEVQP
jgi:hypothetical protein